MLPVLFKDDLSETNIHPSLCRYDGPQESTNMAIIDVKMLSGFTPDSASVEKVSCASYIYVRLWIIHHNGTDEGSVLTARGQHICGPSR